MKICKTQTELNDMLKAGEKCKVENGYFEIHDSSTVRAYDSSTVRAYDSSTVRAYGSSTVYAYGSSTVYAYDSSTVYAYGSSTVRAYDSSTVRAYDSSTVRAYGSSAVRAYDSSTVYAYGSSTVRAYGSSTVHAYGSSTVRARKFNSVTIYGQKVQANGGVRIHIPYNFTAREWCDFYGVEIKKGIAILYKGLDADYSTENARARGLTYTLGSKPVAPDWDGGEAECGGGIHLSPTPIHTLEFNSAAKIFMAFPVKLSQIKPYKNAAYPAKIKVRTVCAPIYEVDIDGNRKEPKP